MQQRCGAVAPIAHASGSGDDRMARGRSEDGARQTVMVGRGLNRAWAGDTLGRFAAGLSFACVAGERDRLPSIAPNPESEHNPIRASASPHPLHADEESRGDPLCIAGGDSEPNGEAAAARDGGRGTAVGLQLQRVG